MTTFILSFCHFIVDSDYVFIQFELKSPYEILYFFQFSYQYLVIYHFSLIFANDEKTFTAHRFCVLF